jgi:L-lactate dehydrogenase complex protein LldE
MRVGLFVTCLVDLMRPSIGFASVKLLEAAGCEVIVPATQTCCGQPGWSAGERSSARSLAEKVLDEFEHCDFVVVPSGSCAGTIRIDYPALFVDSPYLLGRAKALAGQTFELTQFLVEVLRIDTVPGMFDGTVTYHDSCSGLRGLGVKAQPRSLLAKVPGLVLKEMPENEVCCGFGGAFAVKFPDISTQMAQAKCRAIHSVNADAVVLGDLGCMLNIEGMLRKLGDTTTRVLHIAEVLAGSA